MKVNLHNQPEEVQIQIIPLIDVVFCILTFFLLGAVNFTRQQAINLDLPKSSTATTSASNSASDKDKLVVYLDASGQIYIDNIVIRREEISTRFAQHLSEHPNGTLILNASRSASYNDVIQTLDLLRELGGNRVFLGLQQQSQQQNNTQNLPINPSDPLPGNIPLPGINPSGNLNPGVPSDLNQFPANGQGINPSGNFPTGIPQAPVAPGNVNPFPNTIPLPGTAPTAPNTGVPQAPTEPGTTNSPPQR
ncbi:MAG TPA: biopolymer transporter ExbD [Nostocaceae cyanobacterium]|nr:biopolymer transporter ExbD [Nostocaceae cyanobacterium]